MLIAGVVSGSVLVVSSAVVRHVHCVLCEVYVHWCFMGVYVQMPEGIVESKGECSNRCQGVSVLANGSLPSQEMLLTQLESVSVQAQKHIYVSLAPACEGLRRDHWPVNVIGVDAGIAVDVESGL